jgi:hypothetical protein
MAEKRATWAITKKFFQHSKKRDFFALFKKRQQTPVSVNKYRCLVKPTFFTFVPKRVKNSLKKNIVSNLP